MRNKMVRILMSPDKEMTKTRGASGVLSRLLRRILFDLDVNLQQWSYYLHDFVTDQRNGVPNTRKDQTSMRGNLTKEFAREQTTWKVFMKFLRFMKFVKIEIRIRAYRENGTYTDHEEAVEFGGRRNLNQFLEELDQDEKEEEPGHWHPALDHHYADRDAQGNLPSIPDPVLAPLPPMSPKATIPTFAPVGQRLLTPLQQYSVPPPPTPSLPKKDTGSAFGSSFFTAKPKKGENK